MVTLYDHSNAAWAPRIEEFQGPILYDGAATYARNDLVKAVVLYNRYSPRPLTEEEIRKVPEIVRGTYLLWVSHWFWLFPQPLDTDDDAYAGISKEIEAFIRFTEDFPDGNGRNFLQEVQDAMARLQTDLDRLTPSQHTGSNILNTSHVVDLAA